MSEFVSLAIPEIVNDALSYYECVQKLINAVNELYKLFYGGISEKTQKEIEAAVQEAASKIFANTIYDEANHAIVFNVGIVEG